MVLANFHVVLGGSCWEAIALCRELSVSKENKLDAAVAPVMRHDKSIKVQSVGVQKMNAICNEQSNAPRGHASGLAI